MSTRSCRLTMDQPRSYRVLDGGLVRLQLPDDLGICYTESMELEQGLFLGRLNYHPVRPLIEESDGPHAGRVMVVTIGLRGQSGYRGDDKSNLLFKAGHTTVTAFPAIHGERHYEADDSVSQLRLIINEVALSKYAGEVRAHHILSGAGLHCLSFHDSSKATMAHAAALTRYMQPNQMAQSADSNRLDLYIHTLSLLAEQFNLLSPAISIRTNALSVDDIERIERARDILSHQLAGPLTAEYLAAAVGINEHKLKEGFRHLYDNTPAGILLELRMRKAYTLLEAGQQVAQTAWQVGYKYPNNFSAAFTRYFSRSPKSILGNKRP